MSWCRRGSAEDLDSRTRPERPGSRFAMWETAARADMATFSGSWLHHLQHQYDDAEVLPACVRHYSTTCRSAAFEEVPQRLVAKELSRLLYYKASHATDVLVPRSIRTIEAEVQRSGGFGAVSTRRTSSCTSGRPGSRQCRRAPHRH